MSLKGHIAQLTIYFWTWKALLLLLAWLAPGPGYDTSTTLLRGANKLVRWDAIYYVQKAQRGDIFEQEWAFGKGLSTLLRIFTPHDRSITAIAISGIALSHFAHHAAVILVYDIARTIYKDRKDEGTARRVPFVAACLHIISPAGIFLSAPYSEAPFACVNMLGFWLYLQAKSRASAASMQRCGLLLSAGISFGLATMVRGNGVLSGLVFLLDAISLSFDILQDLQRSSVSGARLLQLAATVLGGICVAAGLLIPQYVAYIEYCSAPPEPRPWCNNHLPLIYSFVQSHYWNVGFLRYWTVSNLPLFLLAAPSLYLLVRSGVGGIIGPRSPWRQGPIPRLALPPLVLAFLAITNYHVQIITRLASGYPWMYMWVSEKMYSMPTKANWGTRFFVMYGLIQAGLFASFLPPA